MKLLSMRIQDFGGVELFEVSPGGQSAVINGPNGSGKTSVLNALIAALGAKVEDKPTQPMREGANETKVDLQVEGFTVSRVWKKGKAPTLKVCGDDGKPVKGPQAFLNSLIPAGIAFRPLDFVRQHPAKQREQLLAACGIDLTDIDALRRDSYDARREANSRVKTWESALRTLGPADPNPPTDPVDVSQVASELDTTRQATAARARWIVEVANAEDRVRGGREELAADEASLKEVRAREPVDVDPELAGALGQRLDEASAINTAYRNAEERRKQQKELENAQKDATDAEGNMQALDEAKVSMLAGAQVVPDLEVRDDGLYLDDVELSAVNTQQQIQLGLAIAAKLSPALRLALLDGAESLDNDHWQAVVDQAAAANIQLLATCVQSGDDLSFEIVAPQDGGQTDE